MSLTKAKNYFEVNMAVSAYAFKRSGEGLAGLPSHPRNPELIALAEIADALALDRTELDRPEVRDHLEALRLRYGKAAPADAGDAAAIRQITATYQDRPLPRSGLGLNVEWVSKATGLTVYRVRRDPVERYCLMLAAINGLTAAADRKVTGNESLIDAWGQRLRSEGRPVPVSQSGDAPYWQQIAKEAGLPPNQIQKRELREQVLRFVDEVGLEQADSIGDQLARLRAHVDEAIARGLPMPRAPKGPAYTRLSAELNIPLHRLTTGKRFIEECARWRAAFPLATE